MSHRWKILIAVAVVMLALTGVWVATMSLGPSNDVDAYRKTLIANGEKLKISEVAPQPVPADQNGADTLNQAFRLLIPAGSDSSYEPPTMTPVAPGKAMVGFEQPEVRDYNSTNSWSIEMGMVEADRPATELLRQAMNYPAYDFHLDYEKGPETPLPHLAQMKRCAIRLSAEAMCDLHEGDAASATTNLCATLALVNGMHDERFLISQLVRIAMAAIAAQGSWELLQSTNANDAELAMLQKSWARLEYIHAMEKTILMERAIHESTVEKMRGSNEYFNRIASPYSPGGGSIDFWDSVKFAGAKFMWKTSWTYSDELRMLQDDQITLETMQTIETNGFFNPAYTNMLNQLQANEPTNDPSWINALDQMDLRQMFSERGLITGTAIRRMMLAEVTKRVVVTAIALKRYQLKHRNYPENLDALVPEFLTSVPLDPVDGNPLRYRSNADGTFVLYSIGENGKDDGGNPSLEPGRTGSFFYWLAPHTLDWVWPQPASEAEIQYYYAHAPK